MSVKQLKRLWDLQNVAVPASEVPDDEVFGAIKSIPKHYSANLIVDIQNTAIYGPSLFSTNASPGGQQAAAVNPSGILCGLSGIAIGAPIDLLHADTYCNIYIAGQDLASGPLIIGVQTSDSDVSGTYTDPTSGLAQFPTTFSSGGNLILGSGATGYTPGTWGAGTSGQFLLSGFTAFAAFQRLGRFARLIFNSGFYLGPLQAGFISNMRTTGSGGGYTPAPSSGGVNV